MRADSPHPSSPSTPRTVDYLHGRLGVWLRQIIDHTPAVIYVKDLEGRYLLINKEFETLFNVQQETFSGKTDYDLFPPEMADQYRRNDAAVVSSGATLTTEETAPHADGLRTWVSTKFPLRDASGKLFAVAGISTDISDRVRRRRMEQELQTVEEIQSRLYPDSSPEIPGYDIAGAAFSAQTACGDYYDFIPLKHRRLAIAVGDVSGHGLGPALQMVETRAYLRAVLEREQTPESALQQLNRMLESDLPSGAFVSMLLCFLDIDRRILLYAGAGHDGFLLRESGDGVRLMSTGLVLGLKESAALRGSAPWTLHSGDHLLLSTDGIVETLSPAGELFGWPRLLEAARQNRHLTAAEMVREIYSICLQFAGSRPRTDDATLVVVKVV